MDILGLLASAAEVCRVEPRIQNFYSWVSKKVELKIYGLFR